jgi:hypothetical protein
VAGRTCVRTASGHRLVHFTLLLFAFNVVSVHLSFDVCIRMCVCLPTHLFLCIIVFTLSCIVTFLFLYSQIVRITPLIYLH